MPCCNLTPFDVSHTDRITNDPELVTCRTEPSLKARVFQALDNARENGYDSLLRQGAYNVAADLADYDGDLEDENVDLVAMAVTDWKEENHGFSR
jgi:hypothetical protein